MNYTDRVRQTIARYSPQDVLLADIAARIQLTPTEHNTAIGHYNVMSDWIGRPNSALYGTFDGLYAQGGFSTGSTIASHDDRSEFDLDAMAKIKWPVNVDPEYALATLHRSIAAEPGSRYHDKAERKTRCTQIHYENMHLDVTPSIVLPHMVERTSLIFHSKPSDLSVPRQRLLANPLGLAEWFNERTRADEAFGSFFEGRSLDYDRVILLAKADTTPVPDQMPLYRKSKQTVVLQLVKRMRNVAYDLRHKGMRLPPSVLLTYYIGEQAGQERSLLDELIYHIDTIAMTLWTAEAMGKTVVARNPRCDEDILTDRWPGSLREQRIFIDELYHFSAELNRLKRGVPMREMREILEDLFGETPARDVIKRYPDNYTNDNAQGGGLYIPGRGAIPALGSMAAPNVARAMPTSTPFGD